MRQGIKEYPLSVGQERIWFEEQIEPGTSTYNVPYCFQLRGNVSFKALEQSLRAVVDRHEILRTVFAGDKDRNVQIVGSYDPAMFISSDCRNLDVADRLSEAIRV